MERTAILGSSKHFPINIVNLDKRMEKWLIEAEKRIFSIAAGNRVGELAPEIMKIGFAKLLYAATEMGADIEQSKPYVFFAPDGTISYNELRTKRGYTYGNIIKAGFDGLMGAHNSMPNGCGFSLYELKGWEDNDEKLISDLKEIKSHITKEQAEELGKGNHFIVVYRVLDPITGEDTGKRFALLHCSGHDLSKKPVYNPDWLKDDDGYNKVKTPHGDIWLFEGDAKIKYLEEFRKLDKHNKEGRHQVMVDLFDENSFELLSTITHQGLSEDGMYHYLGIQKSEKLIPVAFNAIEGSLIMKTKNNLSKKFINCWGEQGDRALELGYIKEFTQLNFTPHGGGYEFRYKIDKCTIELNNEGIKELRIKLKDNNDNAIKLHETYFKPMREYMTYRRKMSIMAEVFKADLGTHVYDLQPLFQIHPDVSVPGGR